MEDFNGSVIQRLPQVARPFILPEYGPDSCIASSFIGMKVLQHFKIPAKPLLVYNFILNHGFIAAVNIHSRMPHDAAELEEWHVRFGAHSIGLGIRKGLNQQKKLDGHVVLQTEDYLVDMSLDQASRPEYDMTLFPSAFKISKNDFDSTMAQDKQVIFDWKTNNDKAIKMITRMANVQSINADIRLWSLTNVNRAIIEQIVSELERQINLGHAM